MRPLLTPESSAKLLRDDVLEPRRLGADAHERRLLVVLAQRWSELVRRRAVPARTACTVTWMPRANGPECGTNAKSRVDARRRRASARDLRRVAMRERVVGVQIAVPLRVVRARRRAAARARAAGDAGDEQPRLDEPEREQRHAREQHRGREAPGMRDVRRRQMRRGAPARRT